MLPAVCGAAALPAAAGSCVIRRPALPGGPYTGAGAAPALAAGAARRLLAGAAGVVLAARALLCPRCAAPAPSVGRAARCGLAAAARPWLALGPGGLGGGLSWRGGVTTAVAI